MTQEILRYIDNPVLLWSVLLGSIAITGGLWIYKLHPTWAITRHQIATAKFDRLYEAYKEYRTSPQNANEISASTFRFEGALKDYCKTPVHHRIGDMALRAESPMQALDDLRKDSKIITYRNGFFQRTFKPYRFPYKSDYSKNRKIALIFYVMFCIAIGAPIIAGVSGYLSFHITALSAISLGYFPGLFFLEFIRASNRADRLYRLSEIIFANGGKTYGDAGGIKR